MFYNFLKYIIGFFLRIIYPYEVINMPTIEDKAYVLIANHKSNLDPLILSILFPRKIRWMAKKELFETPFIKHVMKGVDAISVDRDNGDAKSTLQAIRVIKGGEVLGIFPEGTRVKRIDYKAAKPGTVLLAARTGTDIIPVYIEGDYKPFRKRRYIFREIIPFEKQKLTEEEYSRKMEKIMEIIYEGRQSIGDHS
ncbi:1-acyl-sn-glycerol-3-phosphate acyltransferase [Aedoeadaptatus coxii]|uniref:1-acyl-sn-glycerol-3-phosphate acyltransferase n=1 Tax=Aedoeadaptatus coxii TaxID=755172 RepID=A0A134ABP1_9FIRM|nr:lysophospholipid acyltransferase family protein [Peptoniphilus coxii]KXB65134.1 Acyltransferase [Peptoniphilus coxii]